MSEVVLKERLKAVTRYVRMVTVEVHCEACGGVEVIERAYAGVKRRYCRECARQRHNEVMRKQRERKAREEGREYPKTRRKYHHLVGE